MTEISIIHFLLARIAEEEIVAMNARTIDIPKIKYLGNGQYGDEYVVPVEPSPELQRSVTWCMNSGPSSPGVSGTDTHGTALFELFDPARVLAECWAKRRLVIMHSERCQVCAGDERCILHDTSAGPCDHFMDPNDYEVLRVMASVHSGHADYQSIWSL